MVTARDLPAAVRDALTRLAESSDRASPAVFAGREQEFALLDSAVRGVQRDEAGHTVVVQGVPGAGKTALLNEYAARLLTANVGAARPILPVPLQPGAINAPPVAIAQEIDRQFREFQASDDWGRRASRAAGAASLVANVLFAALTKKDFSHFRTSAKSPDSLPIALEDYVAFRLDRRESTIVLLVDEAQNLHDTTRVRDHLGVLHGGIKGRTQVLLACFGLESTADRLRELGLSRLASGHNRSIGVLSDEDARRTVTGALELALADFRFDEPSGEGARRRWIAAAAATILAESANFPHHLANGCRALAQVALAEGIGEAPPTRELRSRCREHKRQYYDARLYPWAKHMTALVYAFAGDEAGWTRIEDIVLALKASDDFGRPVDEDTATTVVEELCASGYVERRMGVCRPALPSLAAYFTEVRRAATPRSGAAQAVRAALSERNRPRSRPR